MDLIIILIIITPVNFKIWKTFSFRRKRKTPIILVICSTLQTSLTSNYSIYMVSLASTRIILLTSLATTQYHLSVANDVNRMLWVEADDTIWMLWFRANDTIWMLQFEANAISRVPYITKIISFLLFSPKWKRFSNFQVYSCD